MKLISFHSFARYHTLYRFVLHMFSHAWSCHCCTVENYIDMNIQRLVIFFLYFFSSFSKWKIAMPTAHFRRIFFVRFLFSLLWYLLSLRLWYDCLELFEKWRKKKAESWKTESESMEEEEEAAAKNRWRASIRLIFDVMVEMVSFYYYITTYSMQKLQPHELVSSCNQNYMRYATHTYLTHPRQTFYVVQKQIVSFQFIHVVSLLGTFDFENEFVMIWWMVILIKSWPIVFFFCKINEILPRPFHPLVPIVFSIVASPLGESGLVCFGYLNKLITSFYLYSYSHISPFRVIDIDVLFRC